MAQYPEDQFLVLAGRKNNSPCIRPHVVFISCNIVLESLLIGGERLSHPGEEEEPSAEAVGATVFTNRWDFRVL